MLAASPLRFLAASLLVLASAACGAGTSASTGGTGGGGAGGAHALAEAPEPLGGRAPRPGSVRVRGELEREADGLPLGNGRIAVRVWGADGVVRVALEESAGPLLDADARAAWVEGLERALAAPEGSERGDLPFAAVAAPAVGSPRVELDLLPGYRIDGFFLDADVGAVRVMTSKALPGEARLSSGLTVGLHSNLPRAAVGGFAWTAPPRLVLPPQLDPAVAGAALATGQPGDANRGWSALEWSEGAESTLLAAAWGRNSPPREGMPYVSALHLTLGTGQPGAELEEHLVGVRAAATKYDAPVSRHRHFAPIDRPFVELAEEGLQERIDVLAYLERSGAPEGAAWPMPDALRARCVSDGETLELFPDAPQGWLDARFERVPVGAGLSISARRVEGRVTAVRIEAESEAEFWLRDPFVGDEVAWNVAPVERGAERLRFRLTAGQVLDAVR